jgi:hypothetical protein
MMNSFSLSAAQIPVKAWKTLRLFCKMLYDTTIPSLQLWLKSPALTAKL